MNGIPQGMITNQLQEAMKQGQMNAAIQVEAIKEALHEIRDNTNGNFKWTMETLQRICDKLEIKLPDPMEMEEKEE